MVEVGFFLQASTGFGGGSVREAHDFEALAMRALDGSEAVTVLVSATVELDDFDAQLGSFRRNLVRVKRE